MKIQKKVVVALLALAAISLLVACTNTSSTLTPVASETPTAVVVSTHPEGVPPNIPHTLLGRTQCTLCHASGISQVPAEPANHANITSDTLCTICHKPLGVTEVAAPDIPHTIVGRSQCLICHSTGLASAPTAPSEMAVLSNAECVLCHWPSGSTSVSFPSGGGTPVANPQPPDIPHTLEGRSDCLLCHSSTLPADHAGRTNDICTMCHQQGPIVTPTIVHGVVPTPAGTPAATATPGGPPTIPHTLEGRSDCLMCHNGTVAPFPADHAGRTDDMCLLCHQPGSSVSPTATPEPTATPAVAATATPAASGSPVAATPTPVPTPTAGAQTPPNIPHTLEGRSDCTMCHNGTIAPFPADHAGRTNDMCLLCHKQQ